MRRLFIIFSVLIISNAFAYSLHIGNQTIEFTTVKHTTHALNVLTSNNEHYYGAIYSAPFPPQVLHFKTAYNEEYFLGPWCVAGTYLPDNVNQCTPCGVGHFCTGGRHRESCTYGAIACNGTNHTFDPPMPSGTDGMYNRALTMSEVNQYIPATDIEQWKLVYGGNPYYASTCGDSPNQSNFSGRDQQISYGTYLVMHEYHYGTDISAVTGSQNYVSSAYIVVFDHNVMYRPLHICNYFYNFFDTLHIPYQEYDLKLPGSFSTNNENVTNVNNISSALSYGVYLYRLK